MGSRPWILTGYSYHINDRKALFGPVPQVKETVCFCSIGLAKQSSETLFQGACVLLLLPGRQDTAPEDKPSPARGGDTLVHTTAHTSFSLSNHRHPPRPHPTLISTQASLLCSSLTSRQEGPLAGTSWN